VLEMRERLHESSDLKECSAILDGSKAELAQGYQQVANALDSPDLPAARSLIARLRFLNTVIEAAEDKIERLHRSNP